MCYTVPLAGALITHGVWGKTKKAKTLWLTLLFYGGSLFGVIDHLWNGELFLISKNIVSDLVLGVVISVSILIVWVLMLIFSKTTKTQVA
jgi:hypothetical protein